MNFPEKWNLFVKYCLWFSQYLTFSYFNNNLMEFWTILYFLFRKVQRHFHSLYLINFISTLDYWSFNHIHNSTLEETLPHPRVYYSLRSSKSGSASNFWFMAFSLREKTNFSVFCEMSQCTKTIFSHFCEDYIVYGFCLASFSSLHISAHGEHHRQRTALPLMDVTTFPVWLIFISFKR